MKRFTKLAAILAATAAVAFSTGTVNAQNTTPDGSVPTASVVAGGSLALSATGFKPGSLVVVSVEPSLVTTETTILSGSLISTVGAVLPQQETLPPAGGCTATGNPTGIIANCQAGDDGSVVSAFTTAASLAPGSYALRYSGVDPSDVARIASQTITIAAADGTTTGGSVGVPSVTGAAIASVAVAAAALAAVGVVLFGFGRSRRDATDNS